LPGEKEEPVLSCEHDLIKAMSEPLTKAVIVMTKNNIYKLRTGRIQEFHFHGSQLHMGRITFFVSDEKHKVLPNSKIGKIAVQFGEVAPIALTKEYIKKLQDGEIFGPNIPTNPPIEVIIMSAQTYHKLLTEQEAKS
jgi:hypothetical protein